MTFLIAIKLILFSNKEKKRKKKSVNDRFLNQICGQLGCMKIPVDSKYLRSPLFLIKRKSKDFKFLLEKLKSYTF